MSADNLIGCEKCHALPGQVCVCDPSGICTTHPPTGDHWHIPGPGAPLCCRHCGTVWPGRPIAEPYTPRDHTNAYTELAEQPRWHRRVGAMLDELEEVA